ncbi:unnamed protein product, partial [Rotaria socialis]
IQDCDLYLAMPVSGGIVEDKHGLSAKYQQKTIFCDKNGFRIRGDIGADTGVGCGGLKTLSYME